MDNSTHTNRIRINHNLSPLESIKMELAAYTLPQLHSLRGKLESQITTMEQSWSFWLFGDRASNLLKFNSKIVILEQIKAHIYLKQVGQVSSGS